MVTRRGWMALLLAAALLFAGRLLGIPELFALATADVVLVAAAVVYVRATRFQLEATRELHPPRVHAGTTSRVALAVRNASFRRSPVLTARDPFDGGRRWARLLLAPLAAGETAHAAYRLPTERRGVFDLGPLELQLSDPFGLAEMRFEAAAATKLTVYPAIDAVEPLPLTRGNDPHAGASRRHSLAFAGEDFYALRDYQEGDDLRRVHWGATAKLGELMIRQEEMPWQSRSTVLLDLRAGVHTPESLEMAVSAAASIVAASWNSRALVRLVSTGGVDSGFAAGHPHAEAILEHLAAVRAERRSSLTAVLAGLRRQGNGGALAVITTAAASDADLDAVAQLRSRFATVVLVMLERSALDPTVAGHRTPTRSVPPVSGVVRVSAQRRFAEAWAQLGAAHASRGVAP